jgi:hypothetical protein
MTLDEENRIRTALPCLGCTNTNISHRERVLVEIARVYLAAQRGETLEVEPGLPPGCCQRADERNSITIMR